MLDFVRQTLPNLSWLRDSEHQVALRPECWSSEPKADSLNFYAPRFDLKKSPAPWLVGEPVEWPNEMSAPKATQLVARQTPDQGTFALVHQRILEAIKSGGLTKAVPYVSESFQVSEDINWAQWPEARAHWNEQIAFGFQLGDEGMAGITPELLFHVRGCFLTTMALAGTCPLDGPSLLNDKKERWEHDVVIEHIVECLNVLGAITVHETKDVRFPTLRHLRTPITVELNQAPSFDDLVARLHPTAALGGWPRAAALNFLSDHHEDRGRFGAPFGFLTPDEMLCAVAIRSVQWKGRTARVMSEAGVVAGSQADREWRELELKRQSTLKLLGAPWL